MILETLLDIAYPGHPRRPVLPVVKRDTVQRIPVDTTTSQSPVDTVASGVPVDSVPAADTDSVSLVQNFISVGGNDDASSLWWAICVVAVVLLLCIYMARTYRWQHQ